jgi:hypothetical protein
MLLHFSSPIEWCRSRVKGVDSVSAAAGYFDSEVVLEAGIAWWGVFDGN